MNQNSRLYCYAVLVFVCVRYTGDGTGNLSSAGCGEGVYVGGSVDPGCHCHGNVYHPLSECHPQSICCP